LADLNYGNRDAAAKAIREILADYPEDGPTLFYLDRIHAGEVFPNDGIKVD
jgi:hypothetical protein